MMKATFLHLVKPGYKMILRHGVSKVYSMQKLTLKCVMKLDFTDQRCGFMCYSERMNIYRIMLHVDFI